MNANANGRVDILGDKAPDVFQLYDRVQFGVLNIVLHFRNIYTEITLSTIYYVNLL